MTRAVLSEVERFWSKVTPTGFCWEWNAGTGRGGYGAFYRTGRSDESRRKAAHRYAYESLVGPIPEGLTLDHLCRNRICVNPDHLEPVTRGENTLRGFGIQMAALAKRAASECSNGHVRSPENLYVGPKGTQNCRQCRAAARKKYAPKRAARRAKAPCPVCHEEYSTDSLNRHVQRKHGGER